MPSYPGRASYGTSSYFLNPVFDAATTAWVNAVIADGGTVSSTEEGYVDTLIKSLKTHGLFAQLDRLWLFASENTHQAKIDIINLSSCTPSSPTFSANNGYTGNGSTDFINLNFTPSGAGGHYVLNSASVGGYILTSRTTNQNYTLIGTEDSAGTDSTYITPHSLGTNQTSVQINDNNHIFPGDNGNAKGMWVLSRTGSAAGGLYQNNSLLSGSTPSTSTTTMDTSLFALANHVPPGNSIVTASADQTACVFIGGGLISADAIQLSKDINAYMTSLGINVY